MSKLDHMLEPRTSVRRVEVSRRSADAGVSRPTTRRGSSRRRWPRVPWYRRSRGGTDCRRNSCLRGVGKCENRLRSLWLRAADVRARCHYPIVHAAGALTAAAPTPLEGARERREQRHHRVRDQRRRGSGRRRRGCRDGCGRDPCVEDLHVIGPTGAVRVVVATRPVDFRKGAEGLAALVRESI
ncbi:hypothetical protein M2427_005762 [Bradyrhizobium sp. BR13661]|nr:hypothetical protein [Bradyrhizobium sp. BR13661]